MDSASRSPRLPRSPRMPRIPHVVSVPTPRPVFGSEPSIDLIDFAYFMSTVFDSMARTHNPNELLACCTTAAGVCRDVYHWDAKPADIYVHRLTYNHRAPPTVPLTRRALEPSANLTAFSQKQIEEEEF